MTLAHIGVFRLGWVGVAIVVVLAALRLYMWMRDPHPRQPPEPQESGLFAESWKVAAIGAAIFLVGLVITLAASRVPGYVVMTIGGVMIAWYSPRHSRTAS